MNEMSWPAMIYLLGLCVTFAFIIWCVSRSR